METVRVDKKHLRYVLLILLFLLLSCKKDSDDPIIPLPVHEHVTGIHGIKGGLDEFLETYHYDDGRLLKYYTYRPANDGQWLEWLRYTYEYPVEHMIVETREGISDSVWFPANKNEKKFYGDELEELIQYDYDEGSPGNWRPVRKVEWTFDGNRITERMTYTWPNGGWKEYIRSDYEYTGSYWTGMKSYKNNNGTWDTIGCISLIYKGGQLDEVKVYEYRQFEGWALNEQYLLNYDGDMLSVMIINEGSGDSLVWERTLFVSYNENGNPSSYTIDYDCCPTEEIYMTYQEGKGNFRLATQGYSNYIIWPWFPSPVKNRE